MAREDFSAANSSKINGKEEDQLPSYQPQPPFIDFSLLNSSPSSLESRKELDKFKSALSSWGCFQVRLQFNSIQFRILETPNPCPYPESHLNVYD